MLATAVTAERQLTAAIRAAAGGGSYIDPELGGQVAQLGADPIEALSERERNLLRLLALAAALDPTVELHIYDLRGGADMLPLEPVAHRFRLEERVLGLPVRRGLLPDRLFRHAEPPTSPSGRDTARNQKTSTQRRPKTAHHVGCTARPSRPV